jgi:hypothetical protein
VKEEVEVKAADGPPAVAADVVVDVAVVVDVLVEE